MFRSWVTPAAWQRMIAIGSITSTILWGITQDNLIAYAQITPDGSLSTDVTTTDNLNFLIDGGSRADRNLFHSFEQFSVPTNGSAQFRNAIAIENIIGRVTGATPSTIDGVLQANGTANLFLLNPNGFIFGPNARLNIGGSFLATTAESFLFENNLTFSATQPEALLSISTPLGLQMGTDSGSIEVIGSGHQLSQGNDLVKTTNLATESLGLEVSPGHNLALIGSGLTLDGGVLTAAGGHIELGSAQDSIIDFDGENGDWAFAYNDATSWGNIRLVQNALLDTSAEQAGSISLQGNQIRLSKGATLLSQNLGNEPAGLMRVYADEALVIRGVNSDNFRSSIRAEALDAGSGSPVDIQSSLVRIKNGGAIRTTTFGSGDSGTIDIHAEEVLQVVGVSPLASINRTDVSAIGATTIGGSGNAGNIYIDSPMVRVRDGGLISSSTLIGQGDGGDIFIEAESIGLEGNAEQVEGSGIFSTTLSDGNAGNVNINTQELVVLDGNLVTSASAGRGDAGNLDIVASERVLVRDFVPGFNSDSPQVSTISSAVITLDELTRQILGLELTPEGDAGNLTIETPHLRIANSGLVSINNESGNGKAGQLDISAERVVLDNQGTISATTNTGSGGSVNINTRILRLDNGLINASSLSSGRDGNVTIEATDRVEIIGLGSTVLRNNAIIPAFTGEFDPTDITQGIGAFSLGKSRGGRITIQTDQLRLLDGAILATSAFNESSGGNIQVEATDIEVIGSVLTTSTFGSGQAGDIQIDTVNLSFRGGGQFLGATFGDGDAGTLNVYASGTVLLDGRSFTDRFFASGLSAGALNGSRGNGGNITVSSPILIIQDGAEISASVVAEEFTGFPQPGRDGLRTNSPTRFAHRTVSNSRTSDRISAQAGDIILNATTLILNNGHIIAFSDQGEGGDINLMLDDGLLLANMSTISTRAGTADGGGSDGGNIQIESPFIAAAGNSDIVANAFAGDGGNIQITTQGLFNIAFRDRLTAANDITASSEFGVSGSVRITTPDVDPGTDAALLPTTVNDTTEQVATTCDVNSDSYFVITGQGGLPVEPDGDGDRPWPSILPDFGMIPNRLNPQASSLLPLAPVMSDSLSPLATPLVGTAPPTVQFSSPQEATKMTNAPDGSVQLISGVATTAEHLETCYR